MNRQPQRIISLVPSQTELLFDLGLEGRVVGITKFCVRPPHWLRTVARVGGTKTLNLSRIRELNPDLILANREENDRAQIEQLQKEFPLWVSDISTLDDALKMIEYIGGLTFTEPKAMEIIQTIRNGFSDVKLEEQPRPRTLYLMWNEPWMAAAKDTFIGHMLRYAGCENVLDSSYSRYPVVSNELLHRLNPEVIILSSEPFPFKDSHEQQLKRLLPSAHIVFADGEMFSWYGSRLTLAPAYFADFRHHLNGFRT